MCQALTRMLCNRLNDLHIFLICCFILEALTYSAYNNRNRILRQNCSVLIIESRHCIGSVHLGLSWGSKGYLQRVYEEWHTCAGM